MSKRPQLPVALTIAGSDSGGGAGIQADLKTFAALGVHGTSAITCITAQNPKGVYGIQACSADIVRRQIEAVFDELRPAAVKTGMLYSAPIIRVVAEFFRRRPRVPLVVDPVMVSTSGAQLLKPAAVKALCAELLPLATLVTPNLDEAEILVGEKLSSVADLRAAARDVASALRLRGAGQGRAPPRAQGGGGHLLRWPAGAAAQRPLHPGREHARHGLHLFRGDCRAPGAGLLVAAAPCSGPRNTSPRPSPAARPPPATASSTGSGAN